MGRRAGREEAAEHALEREVHNVRITMYATDWCGHCERARRWLDDHGLDYAEHDVEVDADARARRDYLNPRGTVPTFEIDGRVMVGFSPGYMRRAILTSAKRRMGN